MGSKLIDLYSDTKTRPSDGMRRAICEADVGDEQHLEDPTVTRLTERTARLLGQEAAVFLPSGTMANEIAVAAQCRPGDELIAHSSSHILNFEAGGVAALAGVMVRALDGPRGMFDAKLLDEALRPRARHLPRSRMVVLEQTTNIGGGAVWPIGQMRSVSELARSAGLAVHVDGARLLNACVASGVAASDYGTLADTIWLDFTKGLGAPFGAVLAGSSDLIDEAWRWKQRLGGSMRQAGMMAAGCLYALDHNVERLAEDHRLAARLADGLRALPGLRVEVPETNMVYFDVSGTGHDTETFSVALEPLGIRISRQGRHVMRAVTHLDVSESDIDRTVLAIASVIDRTACAS